MCDDFETAEDMPLEAEVRHILEERRASRAQEWAEQAGHMSAAHDEGPQRTVFVADERGNISIQDEEELLFT